MTNENEHDLSPELASALERLDDLVAEFEEHPDPAVQSRVVELLQCVDRVHRAGLRRLTELLGASGLHRPALQSPEVHLLFQLYDLLEGGDRDRAEAAIENIRPAVEATGGRIELLDADRGVITVRLSGTHHSCQNTQAAMRNAIEQTLRDCLPDFTRLEVVQPPVGFVPLGTLKVPQK